MNLDDLKEKAYCEISWRRSQIEYSGAKIITVGFYFTGYNSYSAIEWQQGGGRECLTAHRLWFPPILLQIAIKNQKKIDQEVLNVSKENAPIHRAIYLGSLF